MRMGIRTQISAFRRFRRFFSFSLFSSKPLSYSSVPTSVIGVLGTVLGVAVHANLGRSLIAPVNRRFSLSIIGVAGVGDCDDCGERGSLGVRDRAPPTPMEVSRFMLCERESAGRRSALRVLSSEYLHPANGE